MKIAKSWLVFTVCGIGLCALDFFLEALGHSRIPFGASKFDALLKRFHRARYVAFAEQRTGFAKDACIAFAFFGGIHEDY